MACDALQRRFAALDDHRPRDHAIAIETGDAADLRALARFHYAARRPGPIARVLRAADADGELAGVLVASMPTLNDRWRSIAWPGEYDHADQRTRAEAINADLRLISRVIVDPRYRGRGVAVRLVRAYLADPCTRRTEAIAAMAHACPFFARAGMRPIPLEPSQADRRLARVLGRRGVDAESLAVGGIDDPRLHVALGAWARARRLAERSPERLAMRAYAALAYPPIAFVHDAGARP